MHSFEEDIAMMRCGKALVVSLLKILLEASLLRLARMPEARQPTASAVSSFGLMALSGSTSEMNRCRRSVCHFSTKAYPLMSGRRLLPLTAEPSTGSPVGQLFRSSVWTRHVPAATILLGLRKERDVASSRSVFSRFPACGPGRVGSRPPLVGPSRAVP